VKDKHGPGTAKMVRSVLNGIMGFAARHDAVAANPVRDAGRIRVEPASKPRALTVAEAQTLRAALRADPDAVRRDLVDLADFLLCTGLRIGETLAVTWDALDLDQLGHAQPSMTQDVYFGRKARATGAALLEGLA